MNGGGFLQLNGSPGQIGGLVRGLVADAKELAAGIESFRASVSSPNCFGDDELGMSMKQNYPSTVDIDDNCAMQKSVSDITEDLAHGLTQALNMLEEVVREGEKLVNGSTEIRT